MSAATQSDGRQDAWSVVTRPVLFVFAQPGDTANIATQLRHGDAVCVGETQTVYGDSWSHVLGGALGNTEKQAESNGQPRGDHGWVETAALSHESQAFGRSIDVSRRVGSPAWLRVSSLMGQCFADGSRKQGPAVLDLPAESWVLGLEESHGGAGSILDDNAWQRVALADGQTVWIQGGDVCAGGLPALPDGEALVSEALRMLGRPYVWGGGSTFGMDCSGLTAMLARRSWQQRFLPHSAKRQFEETWEGFEPIGEDRTVEQVGQGTRGEETKPGTAVHRLAEQAEQQWAALMQPGDIVYFAMGGQRVDHVGVYAGDGLFIHASSSGRPCVKRQGLWFECGVDTGSGQLDTIEGSTPLAHQADDDHKPLRTPWAMRMVGVRRLV